MHWSTAVTEHDGMRRDADGFKLTVHVRLMHALVNHAYETNGRWDTEKWGLPINQADQGWTLGLFSSVLLWGLRRLGVRVTAAESRAIMHLWKYAGWLVGVNDDFLLDDEKQQDRLQYHFLLTQGPLTGAGPKLANAIVDAERGMHFAGLSRLRRTYVQVLTRTPRGRDLVQGRGDRSRTRVMQKHFGEGDRHLAPLSAASPAS